MVMTCDHHISGRSVAIDCDLDHGQNNLLQVFLSRVINILRFRLAVSFHSNKTGCFLYFRNQSIFRVGTR